MKSGGGIIGELMAMVVASPVHLRVSGCTHEGNVREMTWRRAVASVVHRIGQLGHFRPRR